MVPRNIYMEQIKAFQDNKLIKVITGLRRCGKSTLLQLFKQHLKQSGVKDKNIIDINFELMAYDNVRDYKQFYEIVRCKILTNEKHYLLLDEIQQVNNWEKAINSLNVESDIDVDIYITGSNAHMLSSDISTLLSGRYVEIKMLPLSFKEFLLFNHLPADYSVEDKFQHYLKYGSLPAVTTYLNTLEKAYIVYQARRFDIKGKEQLKTLSKFYVADTGIRNALMGYSGGDMGHVLETIVYFELLRRGYRVFIGKWYDSEVDFLAIRQDTRKYYQVTQSLMDESVRTRELASLIAITDNYEKTVLSMDKTYITDYEGIRFENIIDFILG